MAKKGSAGKGGKTIPAGSPPAGTGGSMKGGKRGGSGGKRGC
jgi:hypothetical protein